MGGIKAVESSGWIMLHRKLADSDMWTGGEFDRGKAWVDLLLLARWAPGEASFRNGEVVIPLKRGDFAFGIKFLSKRWKWSPGKVDRFLKDLKNGERIEYRKTNVTTVITILNFGEYQGDGHQNGDQTDTRRRPDGDQTDTRRIPDGNVIRKVRRVKERKEGEEGEEARAREDAGAAESDVCDNEDGDAFFYLQALDGDEWPVTNSMLAEYRGAYPDLDMIAEVRTAAQWLKSNPERKTARTLAEMPRFLNGWLKSSQAEPSRRAVALAPAAGPDTDSRQQNEKRQSRTQFAIITAHQLLCRLERRDDDVDLDQVADLLRFLTRADAGAKERDEAKELQAALDESKRKTVP